MGCTEIVAPARFYEVVLLLDPTDRPDDFSKAKMDGP